MKSPVGCEDVVSATPTTSPDRAELAPNSWVELYEQHSRNVYYLALRTLGDPTSAQDVTHDVFLKAFRSLERFRGQASLRTWLYRITINHCRSLLASWQRRNVVPTDNVEVLDSASNTDSPLRVLEVAELGERIQKTLDALPEEYSLLLLLVADEQLSYQEVASLTEQTADAVRGKLYRARKAFIEQFQKTE